MARLREPAVATTGDAVPERLTTCYVQDWVDVETEPVPTNVLSELAIGIDNVEFGWVLLARRRWLAAREHWCVERGMTEAHLVAMHYGHMRPRWRNATH
jgi:hypothetical protein